MKNILFLIILFPSLLYAGFNSGGINTDTLVKKSGDTMTGNLTTTSSITVRGSEFSVGGSTFVIANGRVGIGMVNTTYALDVNGAIHSSNYISTANSIRAPFIMGPSNTIYICDGNSINWMNFATNRNISISTTTVTIPTHKLSVDGGAIVRSSITIIGGTFVSTITFSDGTILVSTSGLGGGGADPSTLLSSTNTWTADQNVKQLVFPDGTIITSTSTLGGGSGGISLDDVSNSTFTHLQTYNLTVGTITADVGNFNEVYVSSLYGKSPINVLSPLNAQNITMTNDLLLNYAIPRIKMHDAEGNEVTIIEKDDGSDGIKVTLNRIRTPSGSIEIGEFGAGNEISIRAILTEDFVVSNSILIDGRDISVDGTKLDTIPANILNSSSTWTAKQTINNDIEINDVNKGVIYPDISYSTQTWRIKVDNGNVIAEKAN